MLKLKLILTAKTPNCDLKKMYVLMKRGARIEKVNISNVSR